MAVAVLTSAASGTSSAAAAGPGQIGDPGYAPALVVPGLGNLAGALDGRPRRRPEQRAHPAGGVPRPAERPEPDRGGAGGPESEPIGPPDPGNSVSTPPHAGPDGPQQAPTVPQPAPDAPATTSRAELEAQLLSATNQSRAANGCPPVQVEWHLSVSAQQHTDDMSTHDYFSHTSPDGRTFDRRIRESGYPGDELGENIASGFASAGDVQSAWMDSAAHRRNILDCSFRNVGIGYDQQGGYWTVDFGD